MRLVWSFWYQDSLANTARMHKRKVGRYVVRTWCDRDGRSVCTGWFME